LTDKWIERKKVAPVSLQRAADGG